MWYFTIRAIYFLRFFFGNNFSKKNTISRLKANMNSDFWALCFEKLCKKNPEKLNFSYGKVSHALKAIRSLNSRKNYFSKLRYSLSVFSRIYNIFNRTSWLFFFWMRALRSLSKWAMYKRLCPPVDSCIRKRLYSGKHFYISLTRFIPFQMTSVCATILNSNPFARVYGNCPYALYRNCLPFNESRSGRWNSGWLCFTAYTELESQRKLSKSSKPLNHVEF